MFSFQRRGANSSASKHSPRMPRLGFEALEDRRLLAIVTVTTAEDVVDLGDGKTSLREAIFATNIVPGPDEIVFDFGHDGPETILLTEGHLAISDTLVISGSGPELLTIDASGSDLTPGESHGDGARAFLINDFDHAQFLDVVLSGIRITGSDNISAIDSQENLTLRSVVAEGNSGSVVNRPYPGLTARVSIVDSRITQNYGQGAIVAGGSIEISGSSIFQNEGSGFAVSASEDLVVQGSEIVANEGMGGIEAISVVVEGSTIAQNRSRGISAIVGVAVSHSRITDNGGAGIYLNNPSPRIPAGDVVIRHSEIARNSSLQTSYAGVDITRARAVTVEDSEIADNGDPASVSESLLSLRGGGGLRVLGLGGSQSDVLGEVTIRRTRIEGNLGGIFTGPIGGQQYSGGGFFIDAHQVTVEDSEVRGNRAISGGGGGLIWADQTRVERTVFADNQVYYFGGGLNVIGELTLVDSTITGNQASGGGGLYVSLRDIATIERTTVSHNMAIGSNGFQSLNRTGYGGGVLALGPTTIVDSAISENSATRGGGGVSFTNFSAVLPDRLEVRSSTIAENSALAGGGVWLSQGMIDQSTISSNTALVGGGIFVAGVRYATTLPRTTVRHSTITFNHASQLGGGISTVGYTSTGSTNVEAYGSMLDVDHTILVGNAAPVGAGLEIAGVFSSSYSLVGFGAETLGPLADNGGPTLTHALLPGSPAIDAGDPQVVDVPLYDQRGEPFRRISGGRIDIGAVEKQAVLQIQGDFDGDGDVDGADFLAWQRGHRSVPAVSTSDDALDIWKNNYGQTGTTPATASISEMTLLGLKLARSENSGPQRSFAVPECRADWDVAATSALQLQGSGTSIAMRPQRRPQSAHEWRAPKEEIDDSLVTAQDVAFATWGTVAGD